MNRLQKKCVIGTAGIHLLLLTILIFGPAFFNRQPKTDNTILTVIPSNILDNALNSGVQDAQAPQPAPQPAVIPPSLQQPPPPLPAPEPKAVQPPAPVQTPSPSLLKAFEEYFSHPKPTPTVTPDMKPVQRTEKRQDDNIKVDLTKVSHKNVTKKPTQDNTSNAKAINSELRSLQKNLSSSTRIDMPGTGTAAMANYITVIQSVYVQALRPHTPEQVVNKDEFTKVSVTIARDGTVVSSHIISRSGDPAWDKAVQTTLDEVTSVAPFPDGATEQERQYTLSFNPEE
jgi:TonB family protein